MKIIVLGMNQRDYKYPDVLGHEISGNKLVITCKTQDGQTLVVIHLLANIAGWQILKKKKEVK